METGYKKHSKVTLIAGFVFVIALAGLILIPSYFHEDDHELESADFSAGESAIAQIPDGLGGTQVGDMAPDFSVLDLEGNEMSLSDFAGQPVMVNFWATWCAPCRVEMPHMQAAYEAFQDDGFVILALNQDESAETVTAYFHDEMNLTFTPLLDENHVVSAEYGAFHIYPSSYFIRPDGTVAAIHRGPANEEQLRDYITTILPDS